jgi:hypothetical protein
LRRASGASRSSTCRRRAAPASARRSPAATAAWRR